MLKTAILRNFNFNRNCDTMKVKYLLSALSISITGAALWMMNLKKDGAVNEYVERVEQQLDSKGHDKAPEGLIGPKNWSIEKELALQKAVDAKRASSKRASKFTWVPVGPDNVSGRTRSLWIDPNEEKNMLSGSVSGGLFKSSDKGVSWEVVNDQMSGLAIASITSDASGDIYVSTGHAQERAFRGTGIYKSTDGGLTFENLNDKYPSILPVLRQGSMIQGHPTVDDFVVVATNFGPYFTKDGGENWERFIPNGCGIGGVAAEVQFMNDRWYITSGGGVIISKKSTPGLNSPATCDDFITANSSNGWFTGLSPSRIVLAPCPNDPNIVYAASVSPTVIPTSGGEHLEAFMKSIDGGATWSNASPAPPTTTINPGFQMSLFGNNGQGNYDFALAVDPNNCDRLVIGGVRMWLIDGSWKQLAFNSRSSRPFYVHSDIHGFKFDMDHNKKRLYIMTDGGIFVTEDATVDNPRIKELARNYSSTQYYGIATAKNGMISGGTQDNGTHIINPSAPGTSAGAINVISGDGFDTDFSTITNYMFGASQFNGLGRVDYSDPYKAVHYMFSGGPNTGSGKAPFISKLRLWDSGNDVTSQDSIEFNNDTIVYKAGSGDGNISNFIGTIPVLQSNAELLWDSVKFYDNSYKQLVKIRQGSNVLEQNGDSVGFVTFSSGEYKFKLAQAPFDGATVDGYYHQRFDSGDTLFLKSLTERLPINYILSSNLEAGRKLKVQDKYQALLVTAVDDGFAITRDALRSDRSAVWFRSTQFTSSIHIGETPIAFEFSKDGDKLYIGTFGGVWRISGLNKMYASNDIDANLTKTRLFQGGVNGITLNPIDDTKMLVVTEGGIRELSNVDVAVNAGATNARLITGDLVSGLPLYDAEYSKENPKQVFLGTYKGVWVSDDITASSVTWTSEVDGFSNVPVYDVRQQHLDYSQAVNHGVVYAGTYGRGIWSTDGVVSVEEDTPQVKENRLEDVRAYPNPASSEVALAFTSSRADFVNVTLYNLAGSEVKNINKYRVGSGQTEIRFSVADIPTGTYIVSIASEGFSKTTKLVVVR